MRLKSIKLSGFKSFVDPTTVPFPSNMTAIVGPNGCGKSNIIDAVRWVMGESSAKNLRGESMTDVIFNGSSGRQPVGQAVIELLFDNTSGKLSGEHAAFAEISIKRKVTREGLSQYYLNGAKCRRRDVTDIFLGTGMGPRSYAIIEQGMIAKLIESKPEELRVYLEEAAGISKYKERRRETEIRMTKTQENLDRLADIRDELGKQLQHLKHQAAAAERYGTYKKEERLTTAKLHTLNWQTLDQQLLGSSKSVSELELKIEHILQQKTANQSAVERARLDLAAKQDAFNQLQAGFYEAGANISKLEQELKYQKERLLQQDQQLLQLQRELNEVTHKLELDTERIEVVLAELEELTPTTEEAAERATVFAAELDQQELAMRSWQLEWDTFNSQAASTRQVAEVEQNTMRQAESRLHQLMERKNKLALEQQELESQSRQNDVSQVDHELMELELGIAAAQSSMLELRPLLEELRLKIDELSAARSESLRDLAEKKGVLASLSTLQQAALGAGEQELDAWLNRYQLSATDRLINEVVVTPGWELAIEHVLESWLKGVVIGSSDSVEQAEFSALKRSLTLIRRQDASAPPLQANTLACCITGATALTDYLNTIKLADSVDRAVLAVGQLLPGESVITPEGTWLGKNWFRHFRPDDGQSGLVARSKEIARYDHELAELEARILSLEGALENAKSQLKDYEEQLRRNDLRHKELLQEQGRLSSVQKMHAVKRDQYQLRLARSTEDLVEVTQSLLAEQTLLAKARAEWQVAMALLEGLADEKELLLEQRESIQLALETNRQQARELQNRAHRLQLELQQKESQRQLLAHSLVKLNEQRTLVEQKITEFNAGERVDDTALKALSVQLENLLYRRLSLEERLTGARSAMEQVMLALRAAEDLRVQHEQTLQDYRVDLEKARMECQALDINRANLAAAVAADGFDLNALLLEITDGITEVDLKNTLERLATKIQRLGPINLAAIDEYQVQNERKTYLDGQHEDLLEALEILLAAIRKIDKDTRARFKETFDLVNEGLQRLFPKIFGGGSACLELTDHDLLETGISIIARPPGKKNATIHLLSGGEKALTAIALVFAIFELNPAPFCMLDEVDAPLDDANVGRFANLVKEMSSQVQFIYISHNKVSMESADQLMGVTMHEPGVSRLVSVDVEQAVALVES